MRCRNTAGKSPNRIGTSHSWAPHLAYQAQLNLGVTHIPRLGTGWATRSRKAEEEAAYLWAPVSHSPVTVWEPKSLPLAFSPLFPEPYVPTKVVVI